MISVYDAENIIRENTSLFPEKVLSLHDAAGEVLRETVYSDRDQPPFDRITMDGIAISFSAWETGHTFFPVEALSQAGEARKILSDPQNAIEVMTGAVLPEGCDSVAPYEDLDKKEGGFAIRGTLLRGQNVHCQGSDLKAGDTILQKGDLLNGPRLGALASVGKLHLRVSARPRIALLSTGDELVDIDQDLKPFQIRKSNPYAIQASLKGRGYSQIQFFHAKDNREALQDKLSEAISQNDVLILSGGVSMGKADFVPDVLKVLGVSILFHKVAQKPGKPMLFGKTGAGQWVFGLPGNPVSVLVCLTRYILPALNRSLGLMPKIKTLQMAADFQRKNSNFTLFLPVRESSPKAHCLDGEFTSGDFASLAKSDGFVEMEVGKTLFLKGDALPFFPWGAS